MQRKSRTGLAIFIGTMGLGMLLGAVGSEWLGQILATALGIVVLATGILALAWETR